MVSKKEVAAKQAQTLKRVRKPPERVSQLQHAEQEAGEAYLLSKATQLKQATAARRKIQEAAVALETARIETERLAQLAKDHEAAVLKEHLDECEAPLATLRMSLAAVPLEAKKQARLAGEHETRAALIEKQLAEREAEQVKIDPWVEPEPVRRSFWQWLMGR